MIHDLKDVKEMFEEADKLIQERPELLSMNLDDIFDELDGDIPNMTHIRWGVMTRAKITEIKSFDNKGIIDFLTSIKERNLLNEYIGYILQNDYQISLMSVLLDDYASSRYNELIPFIIPCLEYEEKCFVEKIEDILDIISIINDKDKFGFIQGYAVLSIKNEKEDIILKKYLDSYSDSLEQLVSQLGNELYIKRSVKAKKWLDIYINEEEKYCKKMGIHFLYRSLFNDCDAFQEHFLLLEKKLVVIQELWELLIPVYVQYLLYKDETLYKERVKKRLINVKNGSLKSKRICVQAINCRLNQSKEYITIIDNIISTSFGKDNQILQGLDYYFEYIFNVDSSNSLKLLYELYEMNEYRSGEAFLELLPQTCRRMSHNQSEVLYLWWDKFMHGSNLEFQLSVEIFSTIISLDNIDCLLKHMTVSKDELLLLLEGIYLFTIDEKKISNLMFLISSYIKDTDFFTQYCIDNIFINYSGALLNIAKQYLESDDIYKLTLAKNIIKYYDLCKEKIQKGYENKDFIPPTDRKIIYHRALIEQNKNIQKQAEEHSVIAKIFPPRKMKYGNRFAFVQTQKKGKYNYSVNGYAENTVSVELPRSFINNPMKYIYMKMNYLEKEVKMRLIVKEYIAQLKEKDELDILISEIFEQKGYIADSQPKTGNRQYGVDIQLHSKEELLLFVVKQGDIDRDAWDGGVNAVRQSLEEIKDVIMNSLTYVEKQKKLRIIVTTNGIKDEAIKQNWNGYVNSNKEWNGIPINIEFMGIDNIVNEILNNFFNEYLFDSVLHSSMRKALYFIDEGDYKRGYYEEIVDAIVLKIKDAGRNKRKLNKACSTLHLASQMICKYANDMGNTKVAIDISEYVIIKYWKYLVEEELLGKVQKIEWLSKFCKCYEKWNEVYVEKIEKIVNNEIILPNYNVVENRVLVYEILGYLSSYGNYLLDIEPNKSNRVLNIIAGILNDYEYYVYAPYDVSIGVIIMIYKLLLYFERKEEVRYLLRYQTKTLMHHYELNNKFPAPSDTFEEAMEIEMNAGKVEYDVSAFWGYSLLLIQYMNDSELYMNLQKFLQIKIGKVSKCVWFLRKDEELKFYEYFAMNLAGEGTEITIEDQFENFKKKVDFVLSQYDKEKFTFDEYCFSSLEILICHYYVYIPRIRFIK